MEVIKIIDNCIKQNISLKVENGEILIEADEGIVTEEILDRIRSSKQEIISFLKCKKSPLSFAQERLWFIDQYEHNASYNIIQAIKLVGNLDIEVLEKTFNEIIRRHEVLRTNLVVINNVPKQIIHEESKFKLEIVDQSHLDHAIADVVIQDLIEIESQKPYDLSTDSLIRLVLYKINDEDYTLFLNKHHIISDGWSFYVFYNEISILYKSFSEHKPALLPELKIQYSDYAVWQRNYIEGEILNKQSEYWNDKLLDTPILELPIDKPRPKEQTYNGSNFPLHFNREVTDQLNKFSKENDVTLFMTLLSVFKVLLYKYTGQEDICVGSPIANRTKTEIEPLIGFFVNTLALRSSLNGEISFIDLVEQIKQTTLDAYDNQDVPFEKVVDSVVPERNIAYSPLVQVMMALQNNPVSELTLGDLTLKPIEIERSISKFDLFLDIIETEEGLYGAIEYNTDLFDKDTIERMGEHLQVLIDSVLSNPTANISDLEILSPKEKQLLLVDLNDTEIAYPSEKSIHQLFEEQVEKTPNSVAISFEDKAITYKELNEKSNQLAHYIQGKGVKLESLVGICVERSVEMIIGILGILKAGAAYVPIDPNLPHERIAFMLEDTNCDVILGLKHLKLPKSNAEIIYLDSDWKTIKKESNKEVVSKAKGDNLAYVIYTSGSTGRPKGTLIEHSSVLSLVHDRRFDFLKNRKTVLQYSTISFDASIFEIWGALCNGSELVICPPRKLSIEELKQVVVKNKVNVIWFTAPLFSLVVENGIEMLKNVDYLLAGGDVLNKSDVSKLLEANKDIIVVNGYGPTESTTFASLYFMDSPKILQNTIPIGKPTDNTKVYVLDKYQSPVPIGIHGELHISGDGLAREYLNRPKLTAEKFIKNPFVDDAKSRLYKTGDLVKYLPDGNIEFIGRIDNQVKVRGFRVELNEIELNLINHAKVDRAIARVLNNKSTQTNEIAAYIKFNHNRDEDDSISDKRVGEWVSLYDDTYSKIEGEDKHEFIGWNSSYTDLPIGQEEMTEWLACTLDLVKQFSPTNILEIGSGTGLILFEMAKHFDTYYGIDNSQESINYIKRVIESSGELSDNVELYLKGADEVHDLNVNAVDTIIINSVTQYFPNLQYLEQVLIDSIDKIENKGFVILGDLRNFQTMEDFFRSTQVYKIEDKGTVDDLKQRIKTEIKNEKELILNPHYFASLQERFQEISHVDIRYKQGQYQTEMNKYRYSVILHINNEKVKEIDKHLDWNSTPDIHAKLEEALKDGTLDVLSLDNVPNYFLEEDERLSRLIDQDQISLVEIKEQITNEPVNGFMSLFKISEDNYRKEIVWNEEKYLCNILFINKKIDGRTAINQSHLYGNSAAQEYSNDTIKRELTIESINEIKSYLEEKLPDFMIPSYFLEIENIPLTPNGKIDSKMLPDPFTDRILSSNIFVAPRDETEKKLANIWQNLLGIGKVGVFDNFFELGGHSLLATQLISKIRETFNIELPLKTVFDKPDLLGFAKIVALTKSSGDIAKIERVARNAEMPVSFAQERLWFIDQYAHSAIYNMPGASKLIGKLNIQVLEKTFSEIIKRHEVLRTNIVTINNVPSQRIHQDSKFKLKTIDYSHLEEEEANEKILERIHIESHKPFDLANESLIRLELYIINDENHIIFLNKHHIVSDGWSISVFYKEISKLYNALIENKPSPLPDLNIQYADFAVWQRDHIGGEILNKQSEYWKNKLTNTPILELPTDRPRPSEQTFKGASVRFQLDKETSEKIYAFGKDNDVTLFMTLLSIFNVLLNKYTGQEDICVGSPIANRTRAEIEPLIGFFVNTLALRSDLSGDIKFIDLVKQIKETTLDAFTNQDIPFEKVVEIVQPERNLSYSSLFQVMMVLQNNPTSEVSFGELSLKPIEFEHIVSRFDIILEFEESPKGIFGRIEYNTDLFDRDRIARMIDHYKVLIQSIISNPMNRISDLEILTTKERQQLLSEWNGTEIDYPKKKCIHQIFEERAEKTPDNIAVVFEAKQLTYRELNEKSNQLAHYLQERGVKPEALVGLCVDRSLEMIIGVLGIIKAGGAYVPIDPNYPKKRKSFMLEDAECKIILSQAGIDLPKTKSEIIYLDTDWNKIESKPIHNAKSNVKSNNLAYVIYTSGSTGKPKGVMLEHAGICNLQQEQGRIFDVTEADIILQFASLSFDASVWEIFMALSKSAKLVLCRSEKLIDVRKLAKLINNQKISIATLPPTILKLLDNNLPSLKKVISAGEDCSTELVKKWARNSTFFNAYGPTETTVCASTYECDIADVNALSIGKALRNCKLYVLDNKMQLAPIGVAGELCVSGENLARGYLRRPELTAKKFVDNPFSNDPNSRLYKTGDLAKYLPDGNIKFIGRIDGQVKIKGIRIELGEIEASLSNLQVVKACAVVAKEDKFGKKRLVSYIVSDNEINIQQIREALSRSLPSFMVPSFYVSLDALPLTINGKVDRQALKDNNDKFKTSHEYLSPRNNTEQKLAEIWSEALSIERVGVYDNFFELGGHSLLATQVISTIRDEFNKELPLKALFENSNLYKLAIRIDEEDSNGVIMKIQKAKNTSIGQTNPNVNKINI